LVFPENRVPRQRKLLVNYESPSLKLRKQKIWPVEDTLRLYSSKRDWKYSD
jgi:hypothetical protein